MSQLSATKYKVTQRLTTRGMVWAVVDRTTGAVMCEGTYVTCSNACREFNANELSDAPTPEAPPVGSIRRVHWAASAGAKRSIFQKLHIPILGMRSR